MGRPEELAGRVRELDRALSSEQLERRRVVAERQAVLQAGVRRGPEAPADGTFGGVKKAKA